MAYNKHTADSVRKYLVNIAHVSIEEKPMFGGLAFLVNEKMCINISGEKLMCRYNPTLYHDVATRRGYLPVIMKKKELSGYCYVLPEGFENEKDFNFWLTICLEFNSQAKPTKKMKK